MAFTKKCSRTTSRQRRGSAGRSKTVSSHPQTGPKLARDARKPLRRTPRDAPRRSKAALGRPTTAPRQSQDGQISPQDDLKQFKTAARPPQNTPRRAKKAPRQPKTVPKPFENSLMSSQDRPKTAQKAEERAKTFPKRSQFPKKRIVQCFLRLGLRRRNTPGPSEDRAEAAQDAPIPPQFYPKTTQNFPRNAPRSL